MILFINACVRKESRTKRLVDELMRHLEGEVQEIKLWEITFPRVDEAFLAKRDSLVANEDWSHPMFDAARQFAAADTVVIAAPFWDLSFPAVLKQYFEQINVPGITFMYGEDGIPKPLCRAQRLYYVMTSGGPYAAEDYGYGYVKALAGSFFGIRQTELIKAVGLDIYGADVQQIMDDAIAEIKNIMGDRLEYVHSGEEVIV